MTGFHWFMKGSCNELRNRELQLEAIALKVLNAMRIGRCSKKFYSSRKAAVRMSCGPMSMEYDRQSGSYRTWVWTETTALLLAR